MFPDMLVGDSCENNQVKQIDTYLPTFVHETDLRTPSKRRLKRKRRVVYWGFVFQSALVFSKLVVFVYHLELY